MKYLKKILSLILALIFCITLLCSCAKDNYVMSYEGQKISAGMYQYWLSRYKALFLYSYANGSDSPAFWSTEVSDGITAETLFTNITDENIKKNLVCMYLFDKYGLSLPEATISSVKSAVDQLVADLGGKKEFNEYAADFGVDAKTLEEIYQIEEKIEVLRTYLYGTNGTEKVTKEEKDTYYNENYARIRHIFFSTSSQYVFDEEGNYTFDEKGNKITTTPTAEEINKKKVVSAALLERIVMESANFEDLLAEYTEDDASKKYENGYYLTASIDYIDEVVEAAFDMKIGEVRMVNSDYGIHIVKRYELDNGGYEDKKNADFFADFEDLVISEVFQNKLSEHLGNISVNQEEKAKYSIVTAKANLQF